jgi:hypothetical protein
MDYKIRVGDSTLQLQQTKKFRSDINVVTDLSYIMGNCQSLVRADRCDLISAGLIRPAIAVA